MDDTEPDKIERTNVTTDRRCDDSERFLYALDNIREALTVWRL